MSAFISSVLLSLVRSLELPLRLAGLDVYARRSDSAVWRFFDFDKLDSTYWGLGLEITVGRARGLRLSDFRGNRWQVMNGLAHVSHLVGWDVFITHDDPRCGLFDFKFNRLSCRSFELYGLGLHVIGGPLGCPLSSS